MNAKRWKKIGWITAVVVVLLVITVPLIVLAVSKAFTAQEHVVRTDWSFETGSTVEENDQWQVDLTEAPLGDGLRALQLVPQDIGGRASPSTTWGYRSGSPTCWRASRPTPA